MKSCAIFNFKLPNFRVARNCLKPFLMTDDCPEKLCLNSRDDYRCKIYFHNRVLQRAHTIIRSLGMHILLCVNPRIITASISLVIQDVADNRDASRDCWDFRGSLTVIGHIHMVHGDILNDRGQTIAANPGEAPPPRHQTLKIALRLYTS